MTKKDSESAVVFREKTLLEPVKPWSWVDVSLAADVG
jgi:hypothetical protein